MISSTYYHKGMRLAAEHISCRHEICPFCSSAVFKRIFTIQHDPDIFLMKCSLCSGVFSDAVPSDSVFEQYYSSYYADFGSHMTFASPGRFAQRICRSLTVEKERDYRILDFGGGDGSLSYALAKMLQKAGASCVEITVVDYSRETLTSDTESVSICHQPSIEAAGGMYDIIIASSVLEHLPRPVDSMQQLFSKLSAGGFFYARHPYIVPLMRVVRLFGITIDFTYPAHLNDFGGDFWKAILRTHCADGFGIVVFSRPSPVETSFSAAPARTAAAYLMKSMWYLTFGFWHLVGGWEIGIVRKK
jgi:SAM-dependent methyltransferase